MTLAAAVRKAGPYLGTGLVSIYPFSFKVFQDTDVAVFVSDLDLVETELSSGYTVTLNVDQDASPGGYITLTAPLILNYTLSIIGDLPEAQGAEIPNNSAFFAEVVEDEFDYLTILIQQHREKLNRALALPTSSTGDPDALVALLLDPATILNLSGTLLSFVSVAALRLVAGTVANQPAILEGYYVAGDGGGGPLYWDATSSAADNGGSVIKPTATSGAGRWLRIQEEGLYIARQWGAKADSPVTDNITVLNNISDAVEAAGKGTIFFHPGDYKTLSEWNINSSYVTIKGEGASLMLGTAGQNGIVFGDGITPKEFCSVLDLQVNALVVKNAGAAIKFDKIQTGFLQRNRIVSQFIGVQYTNSVLTVTDGLRVINPTAATGIGVLVNGTSPNSSNDHYFNDCFIQGDSGGQPLYGIRVEYCTGFWWRGGGALFSGIGLSVDAAAGITNENFWIYGGASFDQCTNQGVKLSAAGAAFIRGFCFDTAWSSSNGEEGILQTGGGVIELSEYKNAKVKNNGKHGLSIATGNDFTITGGHYVSNGTDAATTYDGIKIAPNIGQFHINGVRSYGAIQKDGIEVSGTSDNYSIVNCDCRINGSQGVNDGGSGLNKLVYGNLPFSQNERFRVGGGAALARMLSATTSWNPGSIADGAMESTTVMVTGANLGDVVSVGFTPATAAGWVISGQVSGVDTVRVTLFNKTGGALDLPNGTLRAAVHQFV